MAAYGRRSTGASVSSLSPSGRFYASSGSAFSPRSSTLSQRPASPTRANLRNSQSPSSSSVRFYLDRSISPNRSISVSPQDQVVKKKLLQASKKTCTCSPTTHPGSFRCSLHKNVTGRGRASPYRSNRLNSRRSAMVNSLVRIGTVEGDLVKRTLAALIWPSSHQQKRRPAFQPRPSRLFIMSKADDS